MAEIDWENLDINNCEVDPKFPTIMSEYLTTQLVEKMDLCFTEIGRIWMDIGLPAEMRDEKLQSILKCFNHNLKNVTESEQQLLIESKQFREFKLSQINKILRDLTLASFELPKHGTLAAHNQLLVKKYNELHEIKNKRMESYAKIEERLVKVCQALGTEYNEPIFATDIPSEAELEDRLQLFSSLDSELKDKKKIYDSLKNITEKAIDKLEYKVTDNTERMIIDSNPATFIFSNLNMEVLRNFNHKILTLHAKSQEQVDGLMSKLQTLYHRLNVSERDRQRFAHSLNSCTLSSKLQKLSAEIEKYEEIKKNSIERITKKVREDLKALFEKAYVDNFDDSILTNDNFTEELLDRHEAEYAKLDHFYEVYAEIFAKMQEYKDTLAKKLEADKRNADPNKYSNRGGTLLQYERDFKIQSKKVEKLKNDILSCIDIIQLRKDIPLDAYGLNLDNFFEACQQDYNRLLEEFKNSFRKTVDTPKKFGSAKKTAARVPLSPKATNNKTAVAKATKNLFTSGPTSSALKRKREAADEVLPEENFHRFIGQQDLLHSTVLGPTSDEMCSINKRNRRF